MATIGKSFFAKLVYAARRPGEVNLPAPPDASFAGLQLLHEVAFGGLSGAFQGAVSSYDRNDQAHLVRRMCIGACRGVVFEVTKVLVQQVTPKLKVRSYGFSTLVGCLTGLVSYLADIESGAGHSLGLFQRHVFLGVFVQIAHDHSF